MRIQVTADIPDESADESPEAGGTGMTEDAYMELTEALMELGFEDVTVEAVSEE